jgi:quercetin 2,3-dioxygenase
MIAVRRGKERHHDQRRKREVWLTFYPQDRADPLADGFGTLEFLDEDRVPPGAGIPRRPYDDAEIITYVCEGAITYEDSKGRSGVIQTGEFQRMTAGSGIIRGEANASRTEWAHVFRISLRPSQAGREPGYEQKRFSAAECRGRLRVVASPDARGGSLRMHQDALVYSALLETGQHVVHELSPGRRAWLHVVQGEVTLGDVVLTTGDGAGVAAERVVSLTALANASILLLDVGERLPRLPRNRGADRHERLALGPAIPPVRRTAHVPGSGPSSGDAVATHSGTALFDKLWDSLVDVLGTAATATIVSRAAHRALPRCPELGELAIARVDREYGYLLPRSFDRPDGPPASMRALLDEIQPLLVELTGQVVLRRLERVPELREWATVSP